MKAKIGIRPAIDGRWGGIREGLEEQTMHMAKDAKKLIEENVFYADGSPAEVVISPCTISPKYAFTRSTVSTRFKNG